MIKKVQYFPSDLKELLGIGDIQDMHVAIVDDNVQVLRIMYKETETDGYQTIRVKRPSAPKKKISHKASEINFRDVPDPQVHSPTTGDKLLNMGKAFLKHPMKRPDEW